MTVESLKIAVKNLNAYLEECHNKTDTITITVNVVKAIKENYDELIKFKSKADFVEVVRCKDCKRFLEYADGKKRIEGADGDCRARMMHSCDEQFWGVCFDDFCSFGERKEGRSDE